RGIDVQNQIGTGRGSLRYRLLMPDIFANGQCQLMAAPVNHTGLVANTEIAVFIKYLITGQALLGIPPQTFAAMPETGAVKQLAVFAPREAQHNGNILTGGGNLLQRLLDPQLQTRT